MASQSHPSPRILFATFQFDPTTGELQKSGTPIRIAKQPAQILALFLHRPGEVISRDELHEQLWRGETFVDFEHGLNAAMNKLRQTLSDSADQPRYIETLPGRGYRFIAPVQREMPPTKVPSTLQRVDDPPTLGSKAWRWWVGAGLIAGGLALVYWMWPAPSHETSRAVRFTIAPPEAYFLEPAGTRQAFAVSPDGSRLAFTAVDAQGIYRIFVRDFSALQSRVLPGSEGVTNIFWSPDGASLFAHIRGSLRRTSPEGGSYQVICDLPPILNSGVLLPSGKIQLSNRNQTFEVSATGGTPRLLANQNYSWGQILPDGKHLLHIAFDSTRRSSLARVTRLSETASSRDLLECDSKVIYSPSTARPGAGYLFFVKAGNLLAQPFDPRSLQLLGQPAPVVDKVFTFNPTGAADFSAAAGVLVYRPFSGHSQIAWLDRDGHEVATVWRDNLALKNVRLSPDGRKIATDIYDVEKGGTSIWIIDATTGAARLLATGVGQTANAVWSPDSQRIVYIRAYGGNGPRLFMRGIGENDPEEALFPEPFQIPTDWSPDGRYIAYTNTAFPLIANEQAGDVSVIDLMRARKVTPILQTRFRESTAVFSPDGKRLAFIADDSGRPEIYVQNFEAGDTPRLTGERRPISRNGALFLRWQRDGRAIVYLGTDNHVYSIPVSPGSKAEFGSPVPLFMIPADVRSVLPHAFGFDVAADGKRFLVPTLRTREPASFVVVQNWESLLKR